MIREPAYAGTFYPKDTKELKNQIEEFFKKTKYYNYKKIKAIISPHAGYIYSGQTAAFSYRQLIDQKYDTVIILAPSHRVPLKSASVIPKGLYQTPLGDVTIDERISEKLIQSGFNFVEEAHKYEHSLEVQIPFLQLSLKSFKIVPIIIGQNNLNDMENIAKEIFNVMNGTNSLLVISTDLSHYHSYEEAYEIDSKFIELLSNLEEEDIYESILQRKTEACGVFPLITAIKILKKSGSIKFEKLKYMTSGDTYGDKNKVVGYLSGVII